jgi:hypothetical protein
LSFATAISVFLSLPQPIAMRVPAAANRFKVVCRKIVFEGWAKGDRFCLGQFLKTSQNWPKLLEAL